MSVQIVDLVNVSADQRRQTADLMRAGWPEYYGEGGAGDAMADVAARSAGLDVPSAIAALVDNRVVGTVALNHASFGQQHQRQGPWLVGLIVDPAFRKRGIAAALVEAIQRRAAAKGFEVIYTTTRSARGIMERCGWRDYSTVLSDDNDEWQVMMCDLP